MSTVNPWLPRRTRVSAILQPGAHVALAALQATSARAHTWRCANSEAPSRRKRLHSKLTKHRCPPPPPPFYSVRYLPLATRGPYAVAAVLDHIRTPVAGAPPFNAPEPRPLEVMVQTYYPVGAAPAAAAPRWWGLGVRSVINGRHMPALTLAQRWPLRHFVLSVVAALCQLVYVASRTEGGGVGGYGWWSVGWAAALVAACVLADVREALTRAAFKLPYFGGLKDTSAVAKFASMPPLVWSHVASMRDVAFDGAYVRCTADALAPAFPLAPCAAAAGGWPIVVFFHGLGGNRSLNSSYAAELASHSNSYPTFTTLSPYSYRSLGGNRSLYSSYTAELASHGYVVLCVESNDGTATLTTLPSGRSTYYTPCPHRPEIEGLGLDREWREAQLMRRMRECELVFGHAQALAGPVNGQKSDFTALASVLDPANGTSAQQLDASAIGLYGHSYGACTVLELLHQSEALSRVVDADRIKAAVVMDPWTMPLSDAARAHATAVPLVVMTCEGFQYANNREREDALVAAAAARVAAAPADGPARAVLQINDCTQRWLFRCEAKRPTPRLQLPALPCARAAAALCQLQCTRMTHPPAALDARLTQLALSAFEVLLKGSREAHHVSAVLGEQAALFPQAKVTCAAAGGALAAHRRDGQRNGESRDEL
ncbi:platelet-activating factor acetylhydrolase, isoform II-domain-containing protein [Tribonema minus]|uniref:1-alkyl-2-acetylglycerophosphocholine esterase n=1 Tax=Tribonema minus TaxID=303371 RepID=A0A835YXZ7_9STRA|nr:platelet-activating factor acetylhydrolase, isoform II-domain-containing protein [Tribonema minus]